MEWKKIKKEIKKGLLVGTLGLGLMLYPSKSDAFIISSKKQPYSEKIHISEENYYRTANIWTKINNRFEKKLDEIVSDGKVTKGEAISFDKEISKVIYNGEGWSPLPLDCMMLPEYGKRLWKEVITPSIPYKIKDLSRSELENSLTREYNRKVQVEYAPSNYTTSIEFLRTTKGSLALTGLIFLGMAGGMFGIPYLYYKIKEKLDD